MFAKTSPVASFTAILWAACVESCSPTAAPAPAATPLSQSSAQAPALSPAEPTKVSCVGEQTTHSAHRENDPEYPERLATLLGSAFEVLNRGLPKGRVLRAATAPESDSYFQSEVFAQRVEDQPQVVVLGPWGRHDTYEGNWPEHQAEFADDLRALAQAYIDLPSHPTVLIATPLPYNGETDHAISELLAPTQATAQALSLPVVDLWEVFLHHPEWYKDGTHLSPAGQQQHAQVVAEAIANAR